MQTDFMSLPAAPLRPMRDRLGAAFLACLDRANSRRQLRRLRALDDHMLRDIGITRADLRGF